jgi:mRNA interferase MazF
MTPLRGEVWWVRLDPTMGSEIKKTRPCLVVGSNIVNERRRTVLVVPLSTAPVAAPPLAIPVPSCGKSAVAVVDQLRAASKQRFLRRESMLSGAELTAVEDGLRAVLEI